MADIKIRSMRLKSSFSTKLIMESLKKEYYSIEQLTQNPSLPSITLKVDPRSSIICSVESMTFLQRYQSLCSGHSTMGVVMCNF